MKQQILNKKFDLCAQLACLLLPPVIAWLTDDDGGILFSTYFTVGICQLVSFAINNSHEDKSYQVQGRKIYGNILRVILIGGIISLILVATPLAMITLAYLFIMLFVGVVMAVFYFIITLAELRKLTTMNATLNNEL